MVTDNLNCGSHLPRSTKATVGYSSTDDFDCKTFYPFDCQIQHLLLSGPLCWPIFLELVDIVLSENKE